MPREGRLSYFQSRNIFNCKLLTSTYYTKQACTLFPINAQSSVVYIANPVAETSSGARRSEVLQPRVLDCQTLL